MALTIREATERVDAMGLDSEELFEVAIADAQETIDLHGLTLSAATSCWVGAFMAGIVYGKDHSA